MSSASWSYSVNRGGSWSVAPQYARVAHRYAITPDDSHWTIGVRLMRRYT